MKNVGQELTEIQSVDPIQENLNHLRRLYPEAFADGALNFEVLRQLLGDATSDAGEKYGLRWHGKRLSRALSLTPSVGTLLPHPDESVNWAETKNVMIEGDNLEVLKLLQKSYAQKVKLIYIDPPYNTGKDFVYHDDFKNSLENYLQVTGQADSNGRRTSSNPETSGRFHTDWLNMMYPRLRLARNLLTDDGLLCVSMDDHEAHNLREICDEVFGQESFVGTLTWITTTQPDNIGRARFGLQQNIEYVFMYSKCPRIELPPFILESTGATPKYPHQGKFGACRFEIIERAFDGAYARPTMRFTILGQPPREGKQWQIGEVQARDLESRGRVEIVDGIVKRAVYPEDEADEVTGLVPFWAYLKRVETSQTGKAELTDLLGPGHGVDTIKPISLLAEILSHLPSDSLVLDFFAGSGTTGHAMFEANAADGGRRRFVLVQLPFQLSPDVSEQRSSANFCDSIGRPRNFAEITKERLRRAGNRLVVANPSAGDVGFRVLKLGLSNFRSWEPKGDALQEELVSAVDHIRAERTDRDILVESMIKLGIELNAAIEELQLSSTRVFRVDSGMLLACLDKQIAPGNIESLALELIQRGNETGDASDTTIIFRDSAFDSDVAKTNLTTLLRQHGIDKIHCI